MQNIRRLTPAKTFCLCCLILLAIRWMQSRQPINLDPLNTRQVTVAYVIDGDTFETSERERIRLLGVDAPEIAHHDQTGEWYGPESTEWLRTAIENQSVDLRFGPERKDRYDRTLAWVYLHDGTLVNERLLSTGHAALLDSFGLPPSLEPRLRVAEKKARQQRLGMWQPQD